MLSLLLRLLLPNNSRRRNKLASFINRVRNRRAVTIARNRYNSARQSHYAHAIAVDQIHQPPLVSIVVPCFNTPQKYFEPLLASIFSQVYQNWELVLADASNQSEATDYLAEKAKADTRIKYIKVPNKGIAINTNAAIKHASGDYIAFLDHDDTLDPDALLASIKFFDKNPSYDLVYSDEDKLSDDGEYYFQPHYKPDFSIDMLRNVNYITHFVVAKRTLIEQLKGIRSGFDGAQDYDFLLRVVDCGAEIGHIPKVLYHWREADGSTAADFSNKQHVTDAGCRALNDHYKRRKIENVSARAIANRPGFYRAIYSSKLDNLKIIINLGNTKLLPIECSFIINRYKTNHDVIKHNIKVIESTKAQKEINEKTLIINGAFIPANDKTDLISLFAISSEENVAGVAPKIVRHGRIYDMGIVNLGSRREYLFRGVNPNRALCFGSLEWVRNVNDLSDNACIRNNRNGRFVIWSHSEFIAFSSVDNSKSADQANYYNPNVTELSEIVEQQNDYITDLIELSK